MFRTELVKRLASLLASAAADAPTTQVVDESRALGEWILAECSDASATKKDIDGLKTALEGLKERLDGWKTVASQSQPGRVYYVHVWSLENVRVKEEPAFVEERAIEQCDDRKEDDASHKSHASMTDRMRIVMRRVIRLKYGEETREEQIVSKQCDLSIKKNVCVLARINQYACSIRMNTTECHRSIVAELLASGDVDPLFFTDASPSTLRPFVDANVGCMMFHWSPQRMFKRRVDGSEKTVGGPPMILLQNVPKKEWHLLVPFAIVMSTTPSIRFTSAIIREIRRDVVEKADRKRIVRGVERTIQQMGQRLGLYAHMSLSSMYAQMEVKPSKTWFATHIVQDVWKLI